MKVEIKKGEQLTITFEGKNESVVVNFIEDGQITIAENFETEGPDGPTKTHLESNLGAKDKTGPKLGEKDKTGPKLGEKDKTGPKLGEK